MSEPSELHITSSPTATPAELEVIFEGLRMYNERSAGPTGFRRVHLFARGADGTVRAGLVGKQLWDWLYVELLWVDETLRRQGIGTRLLGQAEAEARANGAKRVLLDTFEFQARPFYEKLGYTVFAELGDFPPGFRRWWLRKDL